MFHLQLLIGTCVITLIVIFHVATLFGIHNTLHSIVNHNRILPTPLLSMLTIAMAVIAIILIHTAEAWSWAAIYMLVGEFQSIEDALYFSVVTSTTLGFGDVTISKTWRLLSAFEAMGGLLFFGLSTAFLISYIQQILFPHYNAAVIEDD